MNLAGIVPLSVYIGIVGTDHVKGMNFPKEIYEHDN